MSILFIFGNSVPNIASKDEICFSRNKSEQDLEFWVFWRHVLGLEPWNSYNLLFGEILKRLKNYF